MNSATKALVLHNVQDDPGWMRWYEKQAIAGDMVWDRDALGGMSPPSGGPCGLEAFDLPVGEIYLPIYTP